MQAAVNRNDGAAKTNGLKGNSPITGKKKFKRQPCAWHSVYRSRDSTGSGSSNSGNRNGRRERLSRSRKFTRCNESMLLCNLAPEQHSITRVIEGHMEVFWFADQLHHKRAKQRKLHAKDLSRGIIPM